MLGTFPVIDVALSLTYAKVKSKHIAEWQEQTPKKSPSVLPVDLLSVVEACSHF